MYECIGLMRKNEWFRIKVTTPYTYIIYSYKGKNKKKEMKKQCEKGKKFEVWS